MRDKPIQLFNAEFLRQEIELQFFSLVFWAFSGLKIRQSQAEEKLDNIVQGIQESQHAHNVLLATWQYWPVIDQPKGICMAGKEAPSTSPKEKGMKHKQAYLTSML